MKKIGLIIAPAALVLAGCASDDFAGNEEDLNSSAPIAFNMQTSKQTRATSSLSGESAATALGNTFIVWGEKNESSDNTSTATSAENTVFKNYVVKYTKDSQNTSTSNTNGWEYVGISHSDYDTNVTENIGSGVAQTIKYWDDKATSYTFTAVSATESDIKDGKVIITKNTTGTDVYSKGYTVQVKSDATTDKIYFADRKVVTKGTDAAYKHEAVSLTFRNFMSKIRFGIYETVPGYKVVITGIKYKSDASTTVTHPTEGDSSDKSFGITGNFIVAGDNTKYTVTYENAESKNENKAKVAVVSEEGKTASTATCLNTKGTDWLSTSKDAPISQYAAAPTYDKSETNGGTTTKGIYTTILPNPSNETNLTLEVAYELYSEDTGEKISIDYTSVDVPAQYCQWKSNYAYTYIFKISDKSTGLYPITFDAVVETDEVGNQETITTETEPSITTFATKTVDSKETLVTGENEYEAGNTIYACVMETNNGKKEPVTLSVTDNSTNIKLYTVTSTDTVNFKITEASVAHALAQSTAPTGAKIKATQVTGTGAPSVVTSVPAEDGTTRKISALKWTAGTAGTVYAIEYINSTNNTKTYKIVKIKPATGD